MSSDVNFESEEGPLARLRRALARRVEQGEIDIPESQRLLSEAQRQHEEQADPRPGDEPDDDVMRELGAGGDPLEAPEQASTLEGALSELAQETSDRTIDGIKDQISSVNGGMFVRGALFALLLMVAAMLVILATVFASAQIVVDAIRSVR